MKICFLGLEIVPVRGDTFYGGLANYVVRLSKGLSRHGHQIHIITSDVNHVLKDDYMTSWGEIHPVWVGAWPFISIPYDLELMFKLLYKLLKEQTKREFDIVHIHSAYSLLGVISLFFPPFLNSPTIFNLHSPIPKGCSELYRRLSSFPLSRLYLSRVNQIIAVSENVKRSLETIGIPSRKIVCVPPAVDMEMFNPKLPRRKVREKIGVDGNTPIIFYCGNWTPWKGVDILVDSMPRIAQKFPEVKLILAWGEPIKWYISRKRMIMQKIKELKLEPNVIEMGIVNIGELMAASDIVVVPFLKTYGVCDKPLTVLEAMACGKPVIATKVGGIPEVIQNRVNGILVNPGVPSEVEEAVCFLLENKKMAEEIGMNAARNISLDYSVDRVVTKLEEIYKELLVN